MILFSDNYAPTFPANHARIGYDNLTPDATVSASTEEAGFPASSVKNQMTYEFWRPTAVPATLAVTFAAQPVDYVGIAAHNLADTGGTVAIEYQQGGVWHTLTFVVPTGIGATLDLDFAAQQYNVFENIADNGAILFQFAEVNCTGVRVTIDGAVSSVGVVYAGRMLEMYRPFYSSHQPGKLSRKTTIKPNKSVNGQFLGRSVLRQGLVEQYGWGNTPISWYQLNIDPLSRAAIEAPLFIAWNPLEHPDHVLYGWTSDDISPTLSGTLNHVDFGFSVEGVE